MRGANGCTAKADVLERPVAPEWNSITYETVAFYYRPLLKGRLSRSQADL